MTKDTLWVIDSLEDWQHQYPRDYELPRLLLQTYQTLARNGFPEAQKAEADVRRTLTIDYKQRTKLAPAERRLIPLNPEIAKTLAGYDRERLTLCSIGSHSALDVARPARRRRVCAISSSPNADASGPTRSTMRVAAPRARLRRCDDRAGEVLPTCSIRACKSA